MNKNILAELVSDIVCAHVAHNHVAASDVPAMIISVYIALANTGAPTAVAEVARPEPSVSIRSSVKPDALVCLECGVKFKSLKRHLSTSHGLTTEGYRQRWDLPRTYPMVSPDYSEVRRRAAVKNALGRKAEQPETEKEAPAVAKAPRKKLKLAL